ncbi:MAG: hypothetical protein O2887_14720 [Bacteroidetes bacterium]|nr:hypothetical protein [Bacteroidota bacterium]
MSKVCVEIAVFLPLTTAPVKLLPLVKMMPSPKHEENTCYFYNRVDPKGFRLISYHYDKEPEIITGGDDIKSALEIFKVTE